MLSKMEEMRQQDIFNLMAVWLDIGLKPARIEQLK